MQTTDLTIKESDLKIVYGPYYRGKEVSIQNLATVKYMYTDLTDIRKYYIRLGFHLNEFDVDKSYLDFGYATLEEFCNVNLGLDKSAVSRCINVYREFNAGDDKEFIGNIVNHGCAMELSDRWKDYSYTQLCEMLPLSPKEREAVTPDMTIKQIREYKKKLKDDQKRSEDTIKFLDGVVRSIKNPVASTQPKRFDWKEYVKKRGIVRQNYVKASDPVEEEGMFDLYVFDCNGREIIGGSCGYVLEIIHNSENDYKIVIRMTGCYNDDPVDLDEILD